ncbi:ion transporter [Glycomyces sp. A-F 0318]|uniref:ion transporter n=1 Tax=Glycomyces amatae TaxID=2881355 RepID=UPI001E45B486|nr:ion transporter [Glycomyces amatae]
MRVPTVGADPGRIPAACRTLLAHRRFQILSISVIVLNGAVLGAMTFGGALDAMGEVLHWVDHVCLAFFAMEVVVGIVSFGRRPWRYFGDGWNVFDFVIVVASFLPGLRENVTILRMLRLARIVRIFRSMPSLRIILVAAGKALPKSAGVFGLTGLVMYLWAMIGWIAFSKSDPDHFDSVGKALLNLFQLVAFDDMGNVIRESMAVNMWTLPYYVVFILFGAFILVNLMIGVVLASMEEAQKIDDEDGQVSADTALLLERIDRLQTTVDKLTDDQRRAREYTPFRQTGNGSGGDGVELGATAVRQGSLPAQDVAGSGPARPPAPPWPPARLMR